MLLEQRNAELRIDMAREDLQIHTIFDPNDFQVTVLITTIGHPYLEKLALRMTQEQLNLLKSKL